MNVLTVGAHWDDIELGCALTIKRLLDTGSKVYGVVLTDSEYKVKDEYERTVSEAIETGLQSFEKIGIEYIKTMKLPNQKMVYSQPMMQELEDICKRNNIEMVFTHWFGDHNTDHRATWEISRTAFRNIPNLLMYQSNAYFDNVEVFVPHHFCGFSEKEYQFKVDIAQTNPKEWEYRKERWEREIFARERYWGYLCRHDYAEAFMVNRMVNKLT